MSSYLRVEDLLVRDGPPREWQMGFLQQTLSVFGPLLGPLGFRLISANPFIVRFESDRVFCEISHDRHHDRIEIGIGGIPYVPGAPKHLLSSILRFLKVAEPSDYTAPASNAEQVCERIQQAADLVDKNCIEALKGDDGFLKRLQQAASPEDAGVVQTIHRHPILSQLEREMPARERRTAFIQEALAIFGPLLTPFGYRLMSANPYMVRFESDRMFLMISHDEETYGLEVSLGKLPYSIDVEEYKLPAILQFMNISFPSDYMAPASDANEVSQRMRQLADLMQKHCADALSGDEGFLAGLHNASFVPQPQYELEDRLEKEGPGRERRIGFLQEVLTVLGPLLGRLDFRLMKASPFMVRFESDGMFLDISHDRLSYTVQVSVGGIPYRIGQEKYSLENILHFLRAPNPSEYMASTSNAEQMHERIRLVAELAEKYCKEALRGDEDFLTRLHKATFPSAAGGIARFIAREGPARERRTGFIQEVLSVFRPALASFGYRLISANAFFVRFESDRMFCEVSHDRLDYIVDVGIGELPYRLGVPKYTLSNLVHFLKIQAGDFTLPASNEKQVHERVRQIADLIEKRLSKALAGDPAFFPRLKKALSSENLAVVSNPALDESVGGLHLESSSSQQERAYGFLREVLAAFSPLLSTLGYRLISANAFIVQYESDGMKFALSHDCFDYFIDLSVSRLDDEDEHSGYVIREFLGISGSGFDKSSLTAEAVRASVWQLADLAREHLTDILKGDEDVLRRLDEFAHDLHSRYNYRMTYGKEPPKGWDPRSDA